MKFFFPWFRSKTIDRLLALSVTQLRNKSIRSSLIDCYCSGSHIVLHDLLNNHGMVANESNYHYGHWKRSAPKQSHFITIRRRHALNSRHAPACILGKKVLYILLTPLLERLAKEPAVTVDTKAMCTNSCRAMGGVSIPWITNQTGKWKLVTKWFLSNYILSSWMSCHTWGVRASLY